ncbi:ATP-NAD kinase [Wolfiporia cocos MD-104 SS10]|uniref:ATP-NAD kinase n=1 Tax=Wolfiporia cocos (strain MD-104) TaxID=742152 RepID=A0A2H3JP75_WOLCO|nr:ATP-NAD kinase [Wolfiporia cocos MD-104 SS10]
MQSPFDEVFSTPPSTPGASRDDLSLSLARRTSRPSSLHLQYTAPPNIVLDQQESPLLKRAMSPSNQNGASPAAGPTTSSGSTLTHPSVTSPAPPSGRPHHAHPSPHTATAKSPYFVHSQLTSSTIQDYLHAKRCKAIHDARMEHNCHCPTGSVHPNGTLSGPLDSHDSEYDDDDDYAGSLTRQLAETAVGVREMSKQLGRTRVHSHIQNVLIVTKARDNRLIKLTRELALYLMLRKTHSGRGMVVYVDAQLKTSRRFDAAGIEREHPEFFVPYPRRRSSSTSSLADDNGNASADLGQLRYWTADMCSRSPHLFDFVVTLGGDGTVLFTSWLFQRIVPPVLPFALGSLGFLTNFDFADHAAVMDSAIDAGIRVNLRMRFTCTVFRAVAAGKGGTRRRAVKKGDTGEILMKNVEKGGWEALESGCAPIYDAGGRGGKDKEIMCFATRPVESFEVLNDLVVDRGPSPYVSQLELFGDEHHLTTVQADGLCVSTPTGSTAYSLSAGGSLVHPEIPAILISPICPHTLSFRPMLLPDSMELRICVPFNSRSTAWASFDGRGRVELRQGDHIKVTASKYPFPTVCADTQSTDWFNAISRTLKWNERERQKSFVVVEESPTRRTDRGRTPGVNGDAPRDEPVGGEPADAEEDECSDEEEEEEEEEKYDIDDLSSTGSPQRVEAALKENELSPREDRLGKEKAAEGLRSVQAQAEHAARLLAEGAALHPSGARSGLHSGVETPDRFAGPHPHPPRVSPRHVQFAPSHESSATSLVSMDRAVDATITQRRERGARERSNGDGQPRRTGQSRSRTPRTREAETDLKTPRTLDETRRRNTSRSRSRDRPYEGHPRRAFAVWGQDESDSAASDSDA